MFFCYFLISTYCFVKRPNGIGEHCVPIANETNTTSLMDPLFVTASMENGTFLPMLDPGDSLVTEASLFETDEMVTIPEFIMHNSTLAFTNSTFGGSAGEDEEESGDDDDGLECDEGFEVQEKDQCYLHTYDSNEKIIRLGCEVVLIIWSIIYIGICARERTFLGNKIWVQNLKLCPSRCGFLIGCFCIIFAVPFRLTCQPEIEDKLAITAMNLISFYFLFFCRGFKTTGPFVTMIYRMTANDLLRFVIIYIIFVMGFAQCKFIFFLCMHTHTF